MEAIKAKLDPLLLHITGFCTIDTSACTTAGLLNVDLKWKPFAVRDIIIESQGGWSRSAVGMAWRAGRGNLLFQLMKVIHGIVWAGNDTKGAWAEKQKEAQNESRLKWLYTWSPSMPLLTPPGRKGSSDPMLKEANYSQYLPHSREARSCRGQACETFLQPAAAAHLPPCSLVLLSSAPSSPSPFFLPLSSVWLWTALISLFAPIFVQPRAFILITTRWVGPNFPLEEGNALACELN